MERTNDTTPKQNLRVLTAASRELARAKTAQWRLPEPGAHVLGFH